MLQGAFSWQGKSMQMMVMNLGFGNKQFAVCLPKLVIAAAASYHQSLPI
jgi:hypothetical protein